MSTMKIYVTNNADNPDPDGMRISKQVPPKKKQRRLFQRKAKNKRPKITAVFKEEEEKEEVEVVNGSTHTGPPAGVTTRHQKQLYSTI